MGYAQYPRGRYPREAASGFLSGTLLAECSQGQSDPWDVEGRRKMRREQLMEIAEIKVWRLE